MGSEQIIMCNEKTVMRNEKTIMRNKQTLAWNAQTLVWNAQTILHNGARVIFLSAQGSLLIIFFKCITPQNMAPAPDSEILLIITKFTMWASYFSERPDVVGT